MAKKKRKPRSKKNKTTPLDSQRSDGWANLITRQGFAARDKTENWGIKRPPVLDSDLLTALYHGDDLAANIVDKYVNEMTREGWQLHHGESTGADTSQELKKYLADLGWDEAERTAMRMARLYGGAAIFVGADDGSDASLPLNLSNISEIRHLTVWANHELTIHRYDDDTSSKTFDQPIEYSVNSTTQIIHASRIIQYDGTFTERLRRRTVNSGWADSAFVRIFAVIRGYAANWKTIETLMADFSQGVYTMTGLAEAMAADQENVIHSRLSLMDYARSSQNSILLDADGEAFSRIATPMAGLPETARLWMSRVASATNMPITLLFGESPGGLSATGESDADNWANEIKGQQTARLLDPLKKFLTIAFATTTGPTGGAEPDSWSIKYIPLYQMTQPEEAAMRKTMAEVDNIYITAGVVLPEEVTLSRVAPDDFTMSTTVDIELRKELLEKAGEELLNEESVPDVSGADVSGQGFNTPATSNPVPQPPK